MTAPLLSRSALARVLTSLLQSEFKAISRVSTKDLNPWMHQDQWPEDLQIGDGGDRALPCDSLDVLRLAAAANEMFHLYEAGEELGLLSAVTFGRWLDRIEAAWSAGVTRITFTTSGSTGRPTRCTHEFSHLQVEVQFLGAVFASRTRIVPLTPSHHIYGFLFTAMLPDQLGVPVRSVADENQSRVDQRFQPGDLVVSFPDRWQWLNRTVVEWPKEVAGVVSTAPCPAELAAALEARGLQSLTEVYGSSESAGVGLRSWPEPRYRLMPQWKVAGASTSEGALLLHISGLQVRTKDVLQFDQHGTFALAGRIDAAVQVGGVNVFPAQVAAAIRSQPGVRDAVVRPTELKDGGRLKAYIVPEPDVETTALRSQLERWMDHALTAVERPKSFVFGPTVPKDEMGKECNW